MNNRRKLRNLERRLVLLVITTISLLVYSGCANKTAFNPTSTTEAQKAPGNFTIPPKVDLLLVEDDTGSSYEPFKAVNAGIGDFLATLQSQGWDYHFATIPLTTNRPLQQVAGSIYDGNHSSWIPPFPAATRSDPGTINSSFFRMFDTYTGLLNQSDITNANGSAEPGFKTIKTLFTSGLGDSNFLRPDAFTVVFVVGNGNDTSDINHCQRSDGIWVPCEAEGKPVCVPTATDPTGGKNDCSSSATSLEFYKSFFTGLKSNFKFYSAVANQISAQCLGGTSRIGYRYQQMSVALGGKSYDICSTPINSVLMDLANSLTVQRIAIKSRYLFVPQDPNPATIKVTRYANGNPAQGSVIPQDATNGWTYEGMVTDVSARYIITPNGQEVSMGNASGYGIKLHGTAELSGNDTADVEYKLAGATPSVSQ